jgi:hypothetical protein
MCAKLIGIRPTEEQRPAPCHSAHLRLGASLEDSLEAMNTKGHLHQAKADRGGAPVGRWTVLRLAIDARD